MGGGIVKWELAKPEQSGRGGNGEMGAGEMWAVEMASKGQCIGLRDAKNFGDKCSTRAISPIGSNVPNRREFVEIGKQEC